MVCKNYINKLAYYVPSPTIRAVSSFGTVLHLQYYSVGLALAKCAPSISVGVCCSHGYDRNCQKWDRLERARYLDGSNAKYIGKWDGFFFAFGQFRPATVTVGIAEGSTDDATVLERSVGRGER
jgi:hypothetical protein